MPKGYHQLSKDERCQSFSLSGTGRSQKEIARAIGYNQSESIPIERNEHLPDKDSHQLH
ncbi:MAG: hypothetical protein WCG14_00040 [Chlamydiia bacterium]